VLAIGIDRPREELYARIDARVDDMMARGLGAEVAALVESGLSASDPGMRGIGYAEFLDPESARDGAGEGERLQSIRDAIAMHTRRYAKRQLTFMRSLPGVRWFHPDRVDEIRDAIEAHLAPEGIFGYTP
jgi:tRNA dimethylallyltransferase